LQSVETEHLQKYGCGLGACRIREEPLGVLPFVIVKAFYPLLLILFSIFD